MFHQNHQNMKASEHFGTVPAALARTTERPTLGREDIIEYYSEAGQDYEAWSKQFNMHFGVYKWGINPLDREAMLQQTNEEVFKTLALKEEDKWVLDLGCGLGGALRYGAAKYPKKQFTGITIVPWQVENGNNLIANEGLEKNAGIIQGNYTNMQVPSNAVDGAYAIESGCYATGAAKADLVNEIHRVLKPGKRFVVMDGFVKNPDKPFGVLGKKCYEAVASNWAVAEFAEVGAMVKAIEDAGFEDVKVEDFSWRIAMSVLHAPFCTLKFLLKKLLKGERLGKQSWNHLTSCALALVLGMNRAKFGYYRISGKKPEA